MMDKKSKKQGDVFTFNENTGRIALASSDQKLPEHIVNTGATNRSDLKQWLTANAVDKLVVGGFSHQQAKALVEVGSILTALK